MKKILLLASIFCFLISCDQGISDNSLVGKWQSKSNENISIEFTESGAYIFCTQHGCTDAEQQLVYHYNRTATDFNLVLGVEGIDTLKHYGKLAFVGDNELSIELYTPLKAFQTKNTFVRR
jgi:hypothetical protein